MQLSHGLVELLLQVLQQHDQDKGYRKECLIQCSNKWGLESEANLKPTAQLLLDI